MKKTAALIFVLLFFHKDFAQKIVQQKVFFTTNENTRIAVNERYSYYFYAADSLKEQINFLIKKIPAWLHYNADEQSISGQCDKPGQYAVQLVAYNKTDSISQNFMLTVHDKRTVNILCLGNSITNGTSTYNSYRRDLWQTLHEDNYDFDFIGSWSKKSGGNEMPGQDFDLDHEGHSGWTFEDILKAPSWDSTRGNLHEWIKNYTPDIVLIELGTNDIFHCRTVSQMFGNLNVILALLREKNKKVKIFLAQIPPLGKQWSDKKLCKNDTTYDEAIKNLNLAFVGYASLHSTEQSPIIPVDQYAGVNTDTDLYDDIHPNVKGEKEMAKRWFDAIKNYLPKLN